MPTAKTQHLCNDKPGEPVGNKKEMTFPSMRILVVEDDYFQADKLASDIRTSGNIVVGPFSDVHEAIHYVDLAQAAILDVKVRDETSFAIADSLRYHATPFLFLTGYESQIIPSRFDRQHIYLKLSRTGPLLQDLHRRHQHHGAPDGPDVEDILTDMIMLAYSLMPDRASAERLVGAVLRRAIAQAGDTVFEGDHRNHLMSLLDDEYRARAMRYLQ